MTVRQRLTAAVALATGLGLAALSSTRANADDVPAAGKAGPAAYTIGPADVLQIIVWKEPDLTRDVTVRFDGVVTVPLLGDIPAAGRTPVQLAETLAQGFARFIEIPRVTVGVLQANSARFYIVGQVGRSGEFPLSGPTTILQALALAGGFKEFAKTEGIVIVRKDQGVVPINYKRIAVGKDVSLNIVLAPGDTIVVP